LYEYDQNAGLVNYVRRKSSNWINITDKISSTFYKTKISNTATCTSGTDTENEYEVEREGYCDLYGYSGTNVKRYICTVGKNANAANSLLGCSDNYVCSRFTVDLNLTDNSYSIYKNTSATGTSTSTTSVPTAYSDTNRFYNCTFSPDYITITCKTKVINPTVHTCTKKTGSGCSNTCSNGDAVSGSGKNAKCPAHAGGDGAVIILW